MTRAGNCKINNASIKFDEQILGAPAPTAASAAQPTGVREKAR